MILFRLKCSHDHEFEAWFRTSASYDEQLSHGDIDCPVCGDKKIGKAPMAPSLSTGRRSHEEEAGDKGSEARAREVARQILEAAGKVREAVDENFEYGDSEERDIYGEASEKEASELDDEGIAIGRIPGPGRRTRTKN